MVSTQNVIKCVHSFQYLLDINVNKYGNNIVLSVWCVTCTWKQQVRSEKLSIFFGLLFLV